MIVTRVFKADKARFAGLLLERHGQSWIYCGFLLFFIAVVFGFALDYRIFIVAVLLVCIVAPALLLILYYNYGMKGENFLNVLEHRMELNTDSISLFLKVKGDEEIEEDDEENEGEPVKEEWKVYEYPISSFGRYSVGKDYVVFPFKSPKEGFLYLPLDAFENQNDFMEAIKMINREKDADN